MDIKKIWRAIFGSESDMRKDKVMINDHLELLTETMHVGYFPDDVQEMVKKHKGRLPSAQEIIEVYNRKVPLNQQLREHKLPQLRSARYVYTCGDEKGDRSNNYCLDFSNGEWLCADVNSVVCVFLVQDV